MTPRTDLDDAADLVADAIKKHPALADSLVPGFRLVPLAPSREEILAHARICRRRTLDAQVREIKRVLGNIERHHATADPVQLAEHLQSAGIKPLRGYTWSASRVTAFKRRYP